MSSIAEQVLEFYQSCPFNTYSSGEAASDSILTSNQVECSYHDLHSLLLQPHVSSFLDIGCGGGWLSLTIAKYYNLDVQGIDFNSAAIAIARNLSSTMGIQASFDTLDLFKVEELGKMFDIVTSLGVLHHTDNPRRACEAISKLVKPEPHGRLYLGLYHLYGRKPFLEYFDRLRSEGKREEELFEAYIKLHCHLADDHHLRSWFRDQVLHPYESQHSLEEVVDWLDDIGFELASTSINRYQKITSLGALIRQERSLEELSYQRNVMEKKYFPGFFTVCAKRRK